MLPKNKGMLQVIRGWKSSEDVEKEIEERHEQPCLMDAFFEAQKKLHPNMRSVGAMLVCNCKKCTLSRGTL